MMLAPPGKTASPAGVRPLPSTQAGAYTPPPSASKRTAGRRPPALFLIASLAGCGALPPADEDVIVSIINVSAFSVTARVSGVLDNRVDTVERQIAPVASTDVAFACVDELVIGDPLEPSAPGVVVSSNGTEVEAIEPFAILRGESFDCGDIVEVIISGSDPQAVDLDLFAFTPP